MQEIERFVTAALRSQDALAWRGGAEQVYGPIKVLYASETSRRPFSRVALSLEDWPAEKKVVMEFVWAGKGPSVADFTAQRLTHVPGFSTEEPDDQDFGALALKLMLLNR